MLFVTREVVSPCLLQADFLLAHVILGRQLTQLFYVDLVVLGSLQHRIDPRKEDARAAASLERRVLVLELALPVRSFSLDRLFEQALFEQDILAVVALAKAVVNAI